MADADDALLSPAERSFLLELNALGVRYLVVGMGAALLQGARGATEDLDLWFESISDARVAKAARKAGGFIVTRSQPPLLGGPLGDRLDLVLSLSGIEDFEAEYQRAVLTDLDGVEVRLMPLARILHSKRTAKRPKDEPGIHQIEVALKVRDALDDDPDETCR
jgi:hypothetical protein